jgi:putative toxin-antitoxin system antitoxin component (TIGR02293 family)
MGDNAIFATLGGAKRLGRQVHGPLDLADLIESGLPRASAQYLRERLELSEAELAALLGVSAKTLQRQSARGDACLTPHQGDRLYRLARIAALAEETLEDASRARQWLHQPQRGLGNRVPLALLTTEAGAREVEDLLGRIEYGVFS